MIGEYITWDDIEEKFKGKYVIITNPVPGAGRFDGGILDSVFDTSKETNDRVIKLCKMGIKNYDQYIYTDEDKSDLTIDGYSFGLSKYL